MTASGNTAAGSPSPSVDGTRNRTPPAVGPGAEGPAAMVTTPKSQNAQPCVLQQGDQRDQRQSDQRRRVIAANLFQQRDAQRLGLGAPGAVVGLLLVQVRRDV